MGGSGEVTNIPTTGSPVMKGQPISRISTRGVILSTLPFRFLKGVSRISQRGLFWPIAFLGMKSSN